MPTPNPNTAKIKLFEDFQKIYTLISLKRLFNTNQSSIQVPIKSGPILYVLEGNGQRDGKEVMCIYRDAGHMTFPIAARKVGSTDVEVRDAANWNRLLEAYAP
jgi:hypothetical protein